MRTSNVRCAGFLCWMLCWDVLDRDGRDLISVSLPVWGRNVLKRHGANSVQPLSGGHVFLCPGSQHSGIVRQLRLCFIFHRLGCILPSCLHSLRRSAIRSLELAVKHEQLQPVCRCHLPQFFIAYLLWSLSGRDFFDDGWGYIPVVVHSLPDKYLFGSGAGLLLGMFSRNITTYLLTSLQTYCSLCAAGTYSSHGNWGNSLYSVPRGPSF